MNSNHTIKKASQKISFIADQVHQIKKEVQSSRLVEILFLNDLLKQYENFCQLLKFHAKILNQMIKTLGWPWDRDGSSHPTKISSHPIPVLAWHGTGSS